MCVYVYLALDYITLDTLVFKKKCHNPFSFEQDSERKGKVILCWSCYKNRCFCLSFFTGLFWFPSKIHLDTKLFSSPIYFHSFISLIAAIKKVQLRNNQWERAWLFGKERRRKLPSLFSLSKTLSSSAYSVESAIMWHLEQLQFFVQNAKKSMGKVWTPYWRIQNRPL